MAVYLELQLIMLYHFCSITEELQSTFEASEIEWPVLRNHATGIAYVIQLAFGASTSILGVQAHTKSKEVHEPNQQFGENESIDIGNSQRLLREGNATFNNRSAMKSGLVKITEKVHS
jgi:hypothetical protein